jgi:hypothetical protein
MKKNLHFQQEQGVGGFAYISDSEIQTFYSMDSGSENLSEHKYKRRKLNKTGSSVEPGVVRKRGRPRKYPVQEMAL